MKSASGAGGRSLSTLKRGKSTFSRRERWYERKGKGTIFRKGIEELSRRDAKAREAEWAEAKWRNRQLKRNVTALLSPENSPEGAIDALSVDLNASGDGCSSAGKQRSRKIREKVRRQLTDAHLVIELQQRRSIASRCEFRD